MKLKVVMHCPAPVLIIIGGRQQTHSQSQSDHSRMKPEQDLHKQCCLSKQLPFPWFQSRHILSYIIGGELPRILRILNTRANLNILGHKNQVCLPFEHNSNTAKQRSMPNRLECMPYHTTAGSHVGTPANTTYDTRFVEKAGLLYTTHPPWRLTQLLNTVLPETMFPTHPVKSFRPRVPELYPLSTNSIFGQQPVR